MYFKFLLIATDSRIAQLFTDGAVRIMKMKLKPQLSNHYPFCGALNPF